MHQSNPSVPIPPPGYPGAFSYKARPGGWAFELKLLPGGGAFEIKNLDYFIRAQNTYTLLCFVVF
jgi:hypothetical protein